MPAGAISEYVNPHIPTQTLQEEKSDHMLNHQVDSLLYVWHDVLCGDLQV